MVKQKLKFSDFPKIDKIYETTFRVCLDSSQRNSRFAGVKKQAQIQRAPVLSPSPFGPKFWGPIIEHVRSSLKFF